MQKMWAGRTAGELSQIADDFNASIGVDCRMYREDIRGSMAHAAMLASQGIIPQSAADAILDGLEGILKDLETGALEIDPHAEDIHMFVEGELTRRIGQDGKWLHTARSPFCLRTICWPTPRCSRAISAALPTRASG